MLSGKNRITWLNNDTELHQVSVKSRCSVFVFNEYEVVLTHTLAIVGKIILYLADHTGPGGNDPVPELHQEIVCQLVPVAARPPAITLVHFVRLPHRVW